MTGEDKCALLLSEVLETEVGFIDPDPQGDDAASGVFFSCRINCSVS